MSMINYVTNLNVDDFSGGWSAMNHHIYQQLKKKYEVNLIQEVDPPYFFKEKLQSKVYRSLGMKGVYPAFTNRRLSAISRIVNPKLLKNTFSFFHGATPWLHVALTSPYALYLDASFVSYIHVYHNANKFNRSQLNLLYQKEAKFLDKAQAVFFSSEWALRDAKTNYKLAGNNFHVAGLGGGFDIDGQFDAETPEPYFLFVGLDFIGKGGDALVNAFSEVRHQFPNFKLKIVGQKPAGNFLERTNVEYLGFIDKSNPEEMQKMISLFAKAYCFILPTSKDMTPLVLLEAGSVGCPVISTKSFGIPEIVADGKTGILVESGTSLQSELQNAMGRICENSDFRNELGRNAIKHVNNNFSWRKTGDRIAEILSQNL